MDAREALRALEAAGSESCRAIYARHGVRGPAFGVSYGTQRTLAKRIGRDSALARALWESGNHDARILATMVADGADLSRAELDAWAKALEDYVLTDALSALAARAPCAPQLVERWIAAKGEWVSTAGWTTLCVLLRDGPAPSTERLAELLETIEQRIHRAPNRTRYAMNLALISIGTYGPDLRERALAAAARIGKVEVDHGETGCKTPDAARYIVKASAHRAARKTARSAQGREGARRPAKTAPAAEAPSARKQAGASRRKTAARKPASTKARAARRPR